MSVEIEEAIRTAHFDVADLGSRKKGRRKYSLAYTIRDTKGLMAAITESIRRENFNVLASYSCPLDEFHGGLFIFEGSGAGDKLLQRLKDWNHDHHPWISVDEEERTVDHESSADSLMYDIHLLAEDEEGILAKLAVLLYEYGINIVTAACHTFKPRSAEVRLCTAQLHVGVPNEPVALALHDALQGMAEEKEWRIQFERRHNQKCAWNGLGLDRAEWN